MTEPAASRPGADRPTTLGELRESGYQPKTIREEMRANLIARMRRGDDLFPGIVGYEQPSSPRSRTPSSPARTSSSSASAVRPRPAWPAAWSTCWTRRSRSSPDRRSTTTRSSRSRRHARDLVAELGDDTPIEWVGRDRRYGEKLATPDTTIADLIGEVDPIKVAEGRYLSDELTISYGLIPRTNRGIFTLNELPDLAERIQVGLLNIMEERDVQIRGYKIRLPLDVFVVASANPEDYTNRGPDHHAAEGPLRLADPHPLPGDDRARDRDHGAGAGASSPPTASRSRCRLHEGDRRRADPPGARRSHDVSQRSGVSVRMSVANYENLISNATRRAIRLGEKPGGAAHLRPGWRSIASTTGKIELETLGEVREDQIVDKLIQSAVARRLQPLLLGPPVRPAGPGLRQRADGRGRRS